MSESEQEPSELEALLGSTETALLLDAIFCAGPAGAVLVRAPDGRAVYVSDYAALLIGRLRDELEGRVSSHGLWLMRAIDAAGHRLPTDEAPIVRALRGEMVVDFEGRVEAADGELIPFSISAAPIRNSSKEIIGAICSLLDQRRTTRLEQRVGELERGLDKATTQHETLFRELTHRVKNHLQIMSGLVSMEARDPALTAAGMADLVKGRLRTLAVVYDSMTRAGVGERVGASLFVGDVCRPYAGGAISIETAVDPDDLTLSSEQAGPLGMLVNEAMSNSVKHAFPDRSGRIWVTLRRLKPGRLRLEIADDGVGWGPRKVGRVSHGMDLMRVFTQQLSGELVLSDRPHGGALVAAELPEIAA